MVPDIPIPFIKKQGFPKTQTGFCLCLMGQDIVKSHLPLRKIKRWFSFFSLWSGDWPGKGGFECVWDKPVYS